MSRHVSEVKLPVLAWLMPLELVGGSQSVEAALGIDHRTGSAGLVYLLNGLLEEGVGEREVGETRIGPLDRCGETAGCQ